MPNDPTDRRYTHDELRTLIQRATELHAASSGETTGTLSQAEVEHIGEELGLPAPYVRRAAAELAAQPSRRGFWGTPFVAEQARMLEGPLTEARWAEVVLALRRRTGRTGATSALGRTRHWTHAVGETEEGISVTRLEATAQPAGEDTLLQVRQRFGGVAVGIYAVTFFAVMMLTTVVALATGLDALPVAGRLAVMALAAAGSLAAGGAGVRAYAARREAELAAWTPMPDEEPSDAERVQGALEAQMLQRHAGRRADEAAVAEARRRQSRV